MLADVAACDADVSALLAEVSASVAASAALFASATADSAAILAMLDSSSAAAAFVFAVSAVFLALFATVSSVGGAVPLPTRNAPLFATLTCTVSPTDAFTVIATGVSSTPPSICTQAVFPSTLTTSACVSYGCVPCFGFLISSTSFLLAFIPMPPPRLSLRCIRVLFSATVF